MYLLTTGTGRRRADPDWLLELPSRMLNAAFGVVDFVGRGTELAALHQWRIRSARLAACLMYAPGGQGKTRLATRFAEEAAAEGWRVVQASSGTGSVLPSASAYDLSFAGAAGILLIVDYADRWPLTELSMLLANSLLHRDGVRVRVLLLARADDLWPALNALVGEHGAQCARLRLAPVGTEHGRRQTMAETARRCFAEVYGAEEADVALPRLNGDDGELGLTLTLHMAALVAVDAHVTGRRPPAELGGLSVYLLDREHRHWALLHEQAAVTTPAAVMNRVVFTASMTGAMPRPAASGLLERLDVADPALDDHGRCYPATAVGLDALEPLYPDRLAEDFLALTLPGHEADYPAQDWALPTTEGILGTDVAATSSGRRRALTFLIAAAARWPHLREAYLYPILLRAPQLALDAGSGALAALATVPGLSPKVMLTLDQMFPEDNHVDLNSGIAAITEVLTVWRDEVHPDPLVRADAHVRCGYRLTNAGRHADALAHEGRAVELCHDADPDQDGRLAVLGDALANLAVSLGVVGRRDEALARAKEAIAVRRELARDGNADSLADLASALGNLAVDLGRVNRRDEAVTAAREAVTIQTRLAKIDRTHLPQLGIVQLNMSRAFADVNRWEDALAHGLESNRIRAELAEAQPQTYRPQHAKALANVAAQLTDLHRPGEALPYIEESVAIQRELADADDMYVPELSAALDTLSRCLSGLGRTGAAVAVAHEMLAIDQRLAATRPAAFLPDVARAQSELCNRLAEAGRYAEALDAAREAVAIRRQLAEANPAAFMPDLAASLHEFARRLSAGGETDEAIRILREVIPLRRALLEQMAPGDARFFEPELALSLNNLATCLADVVRRENPLGRPRIRPSRRKQELTLLTEAVAAVEESTALLARHVGSRPEVAPALASVSEFRRALHARIGRYT
ncbi:tetratricopeptide repeat protein [Micromonospora sp. LH3U1]|uniref:tetratricopeptide repeat protein n=1 Tax=Micromonospora sp. LH3U1 TaxID=3018339 RepID=UPI0023490CCC|nr:tetratricopeptide repeat protein [Micromonospora sp. LH3U1]WCN83841.1 tetratricopeptide repeat protein [Micromonospora sp. LH3U1]